MIGKGKFEEAYRKFSPSKLELFYIKHISAGSLNRSIFGTIIATIGLMIPFIIALIGKIFNLPHSFIIIPSYIYICLLAFAGTFSLIIWHKKVTRINKIRNELGITKKEYNDLVNAYYYHNYYPDIKDYINSILPDE